MSFTSENLHDTQGIHLAPTTSGKVPLEGFVRTVVVVLILLLVALTGCGLNVAGRSTVNYHGAPNLQFESRVPHEQRAALTQDIAHLQTLQFQPLTDQDYKRTLGISEMNGPSLSSWLAQRLHVIVGQDYNWKQNSQIQQLFSSSPQIVGEFLPLVSATTNASNTGAEAYLTGIPQGVVYNLLIDGRPITVNTPRVGIVKIGPGLFSNRIQSTSVSSLANSHLRLTTLFHEGRHGDFNGENACAPHIPCTWLPDMVDSQGRPETACEGFSNGPYQVGVAMLRHFLSSYGNQYTAQEQAGLNLIMGSYAKRLSSSAVFGDDRPEQIR